MTVELVRCPDCGRECWGRYGVASHRAKMHGFTWRHGTLAGYAGDRGEGTRPRRIGCRCSGCVEAKRRYESGRRLPIARRGFPGRTSPDPDRDTARLCEDRDDPADPRRDDVAILHLGPSKALCARTSGVMEAMIRGLSESR